MATNPIGITFLPSDENQALGPKRGQMEGDLGQAFKILSLRLRPPDVQGVHAIAPPDLLHSAGAAGMGGMNPHAAIFDALLKAMSGGGGMTPMSSTPIGAPHAPPPRVIPGAGFNGPINDRTMPGEGNRGSGDPTFSGGPITRRRF